MPASIIQLIIKERRRCLCMHCENNILYNYNEDTLLKYLAADLRYYQQGHSRTSYHVNLL